MNTIEQLVAALKDLLDQGITRQVETGIGMMEELTPAVERAHKAIAAGEAELKRRQDAIAAVEFWISCSTDKQDAYRALLKLLTEETK